MLMSGGSSADEVQHLRRSLRDLLALTSLPALWVGQTPYQMLESLADAIQRILDADIVHARLGSRLQPLTRSVTRTADQYHGAALDQALEAALRQWETRPGGAPASLLPYRHVEGFVRLAVWSLGADGSVLAVGSTRHHFPTEQEHLLLRVAANQGTIALQSAKLLAACEQGWAAAEARASSAT
jgi:hypothetical protein